MSGQDQTCCACCSVSAEEVDRRVRAALCEAAPRIIAVIEERRAVNIPRRRRLWARFVHFVRGVM